MARRVLRYLVVAFLALALIGSVAGGSVDAKKKGVGKSVDSSEIEDGTIQCADIAGAVFPNGCPDDDSGAAPPPPGGGTGNLTVLNFHALPGTAVTTLFTGQGLTITASCEAGPSLTIQGRTDTDNSFIQAFGDDGGAFSETDFDPDFDVGDVQNIGNNQDDELLQFGYYKDSAGPGVTGQFFLEEATGVGGLCHVSGFVVA